MPGTIDLGLVVGEAGPGIPSGGTDGQVLVKNGSGDYSGRWERRPKTVNGVSADETDDIKIRKVPYADNLEDTTAQQSAGEYLIRTTGGSASLSDGDAWLNRIHGRRIHTGYTPESLAMTVTPAQREEGEYAITAELDEDTFKAYVQSSGTITLTYTTAWSANPATYGVTVTGTPIDGDVITIVYVKEVRGTITVSDPQTFVSTGWNLYDHTNGYARVLKYSNDHMFLVGGTYTKLEYSATLAGEKTEITVTGGAFSIPADGYVWVTGGDGTTTYILMTWSDWTSGYEGSWQAYTESEIDLSDIMDDYFPNGLMQVGAVADLIDLSMQRAISYIERLAYNSTNLNTAKNSGRAYEYDENYIYLVRAGAVENEIELDAKYTANDHGMEFVTGSDVAVMAETLYGKNLKEYLSHDIPLKFDEQDAFNEKAKANVGIVENGNAATQAIAKGEFVTWKGEAYTADAAIANGETLAASGGSKNLTKCDKGIGNALNSKIASHGAYEVIASFSSTGTKAPSKPYTNYRFLYVVASYYDYWSPCYGSWFGPVSCAVHDYESVQFQTGNGTASFRLYNGNIVVGSLGGRQKLNFVGIK